MSEPKETTVEEIEWMDFWVKQYKFDYEAIRHVHPNPTAEAIIHAKKQYAIVQSIRKHLEPVTVSRERVERYVRVLSVARGYIRTRMHIIDLLTELGIEVSKEVEP